MPRTPSLIRAPDLAERLGVSVSWLYKRTMSGVIPCRYLGGCLVFDPQEIDAWVKKQPRLRKKPARGNGGTDDNA